MARIIIRSCLNNDFSPFRVTFCFFPVAFFPSWKCQNEEIKYTSEQLSLKGEENSPYVVNTSCRRGCVQDRESGLVGNLRLAVMPGPLHEDLDFKV